MAIQIKRSLPAARIVLLSGQAADEGHTFELLAKPIHPEELVAALKQGG